MRACTHFKQNVLGDPSCRLYLGSFILSFCVEDTKDEACCFWGSRYFISSVLNPFPAFMLYFKSSCILILYLRQDDHSRMAVIRIWKDRGYHFWGQSRSGLVLIDGIGCGLGGEMKTCKEGWRLDLSEHQLCAVFFCLQSLKRILQQDYCRCFLITLGFWEEAAEIWIYCLPDDKV